MEPDATALLRRIADSVQRIEKLLERGEAESNVLSRPLAESDRHAMEMLIPHLAAMGDSAFSVRDLTSFASNRPGLAAAIDLAACKDGNSSMKRLGRLLARAAGHQIEGCTVERLGRERDGTVWVVKRIPETTKRI